jgi:hypothetical protein
VDVSSTAESDHLARSDLGHAPYRRWPLLNRKRYQDRAGGHRDKGILGCDSSIAVSRNCSRSTCVNRALNWSWPVASSAVMPSALKAASKSSASPNTDARLPGIPSHHPWREAVPAQPQGCHLRARRDKAIRDYPISANAWGGDWRCALRTP